MLKLLPGLIVIVTFAVGCGTASDIGTTAASDIGTTAASAPEAQESEVPSNPDESAQATPTTAAGTSTAVPTTTAVSTTTEPTTTAPPTTATTTTIPFEEQLAPGLLSSADLPAGYETIFENGHRIDGSAMGDLTLSPCGTELVEPNATDARWSAFEYPVETAGWPEEGVFVNVTSTIRTLDDEATSDLAALVEDAIAACDGNDVQTPVGTATIQRLTQADASGGTGYQLLFTDGTSALEYVFSADGIDASLQLFGAAPDLTTLGSLAQPFVDAAASRFDDCVSNPSTCTPSLS